MPRGARGGYKRKYLMSQAMLTRTKEMAEKIVSGETLREIGQEYGISTPAVSKIMSTDEARALVKIEQLKLVSSLPKAVENMQGLVEGFGGEGGKTQMAYDATKEVLKSAGLLAMPAGAQTNVTQIFNQQNIIASPIVQKFLEEHTKKLRWEKEEEDPRDRGSEDNRRGW